MDNRRDEGIVPRVVGTVLRVEMSVPGVLYLVFLRTEVQIRQTRHLTWRACVGEFHSCQFPTHRWTRWTPSLLIFRVSFHGPDMKQNILSDNEQPPDAKKR